MNHIGNNTPKNLSYDTLSGDPTPRWLIPVITGTWFLGLFALFWVYSYTHITFWETFKYLLFFSIFLTLIPYKWKVKIIPVDYYLMLVVNIMGFGPLLTSGLLILNFFVVTNSFTSTSAIQKHEYGTGFNAAKTIITLHQGELNEYEKFRTFDSTKRIEITDSDSISYTIATGLFGYAVLQDYHFIRK